MSGPTGRWPWWNGRRMTHMWMRMRYFVGRRVRADGASFWVLWVVKVV